MRVSKSEGYRSLLSSWLRSRVKIDRATWGILGLSNMRHEIQRDSDMGHGHFLKPTGRHGHFLNSTGRHLAFLKSTRKIRTPPSRAPVNELNEKMSSKLGVKFVFHSIWVGCLKYVVRN